jgi:hypothetical protein
MLTTGQEIGHFQAFQPKTSIHLNKSNENIYDNIDEYGLSTNDIIIKEKQDLNENKTTEEKRGEKEIPPANSSAYFETCTSDQQMESEKNAEDYIPKYHGFSYIEKEGFKISIKNHQNGIGNFYISKQNAVLITDKSVIDTNSNDFDLLNHELYLLYFDSGENEIPIGIIERKQILNRNNNIYINTI